MQKVIISWDSYSLFVKIGDKTFYGSDGMYEISKAVADVLAEVGCEVEVNEVY